MASVYDILGLIIGFVSLLAFVKSIKRLISSFLPPTRVRALEGSVAEMRALVDRLEARSIGRLRVGEIAPAEPWAQYREWLDGFTGPLNDLWLEVRQWEDLGLARIHVPTGSPHFTKLCSELARKIDDFHKYLNHQHLYISYPLPRPPTSAPGTADLSLYTGDGDRPREPLTLRPDRVEEIRLTELVETLREDSEAPSLSERAPPTSAPRTPQMTAPTAAHSNPSTSPPSSSLPDTPLDAGDKGPDAQESSNDPAVQLDLRKERLASGLLRSRGLISTGVRALRQRLRDGKIVLVPQDIIRDAKLAAPVTAVYFMAGNGTCPSLADALDRRVDDLADRDLPAFQEGAVSSKISLRIVFKDRDPYQRQVATIGNIHHGEQTIISRARLAQVIARETSAYLHRQGDTSVTVDGRAFPFDQIFLWRLLRVTKGSWQPEFYVEIDRGNNVS